MASFRAEGQCGRDVRDVEASANQLAEMRTLLRLLANHLLEMRGVLSSSAIQKGC